MYVFVYLNCFIVLLTYVALITAHTPSEESLTVSLKDGKIEGIVEKTVNGKAFKSFLGIPFAKPPLGELRFEVSRA